MKLSDLLITATLVLAGACMASRAEATVLFYDTMEGTLANWTASKGLATIAAVPDGSGNALAFTGTTSNGDVATAASFASATGVYTVTLDVYGNCGSGSQCGAFLAVPTAVGQVNGWILSDTPYFGIRQFSDSQRTWERVSYTFSASPGFTLDFESWNGSANAGPFSFYIRNVLLTDDPTGVPVGTLSVTAVPPSIAGTWYGSWQVPPNSGTAQWVVDSQYPDGEISGNFVYLDPISCAPVSPPCTSTWTGTIDANGAITLSTQYGWTYTGMPSPDGSSISGNYSKSLGSLTIAGTWAVSRNQDTLAISNASGPIAGWVSGDPTGLAYQARVPFGPTNSSVLALNTNYIGDSSAPNEIVAFTPGRLPQYIALPPPGNAQPAWTAGADTIPVVFAPSVNLRIQFWDVSTSPGAAQSVALLGAAFAATFYSSQQAGAGGINISYSGPNIIPGAPFNPLTPAKGSSVACTDLTTAGAIGKVQPPMADVLNVYVTDVIQDSKRSALPGVEGLSCGGAILVTTQASPDVLAHEIGHELALSHTGAITSGTCDPILQCTATSEPGFTARDLMYPIAGTLNPYLTSGQVFRTTFDPRSLINGGSGLAEILWQFCPDNPNNPVCGGFQNFPAPTFSTVPDIFGNSLRGIRLPRFECDPLQAVASQPQCPATCKDVWGVDTAASASEASCKLTGQ